MSVLSPRLASARTNRRVERSAKPARLPFLRIPPFPGAKVREFANAPAQPSGHHDPERLIDLIRRHRVGGSYWAAQPKLPQSYLLVRSATALPAAQELAGDLPIILWEPGTGSDRAMMGECDPWHMLKDAKALLAEADDEVGAVAALLNVPIYAVERGRKPVRLHTDTRSCERKLTQTGYENPFTGEPMSVEEAVELCGFWRSLIDSNRDLAGGIGFAFWKQENVAPLLWGGSGPFEFLNSAEGDLPVAIWRSKAPVEEIARLEQARVPIVEVEDGFLRSQGLGSDCIPPLSITVDRLGAYFDPAQPSELELILQNGEFDPELLERARDLRSLIVEARLGKYELGGIELQRPADGRLHILVPGQVEDDRSVMTGGSGLSNLDLLRRVRQDAPDAYILYKPHPDVLAGHRKGAIADRACLEIADEIAGDLPISSLIDMADEVHVNTSQAGFEALIRGKPVTTYGVPFYAGWGLTRDKGVVPERRTSKRTLEELIAAALLLYPRYLDPVTGLPCPAEVVAERLSSGMAHGEGAVVKLRRLQGKLLRRIRSALR